MSPLSQDLAHLQALIGQRVLVRNATANRLPTAGQITRVHSVDAAGLAMTNLVLFPDAEVPRPLTSIYIYPSRDAADAYLANMVGHTPIVGWLVD